MTEPRLIMTNVNEYLRGFLVDSINDRVAIIEFENSILEMRRQTGSSVVEVVIRYIRDKKFVFVHGVQRGGKASALSPDNNIAMVNPIIVVGFKPLDDGYVMRSLTEDEHQFILNNLGLMYVRDDGSEGENAYCLLNVANHPS